MDDKRNRNKMFADTNESGYVWTGRKSTIVNTIVFIQAFYKYTIKHFASNQTIIRPICI